MTTAFLHRFLRFRLRALFALMIVVALPLAWKCNEVSNQRTAAAAVKKAGGRVIYDYQIRHHQPDFTEPPGPRWLRQILGDDFFAQIEEADFRAILRPKREKLDKAISSLGALGSIRRVYLEGAGDSTITRLGEIRSLDTLSVHGDFTDHGVRSLVQLKLSDLALDSHNLKDEAFLAFARMSTLVRLSVKGDFTDEGIAQLELPHLEYLALDSANVTRRGVLELKRLKTLRTFHWGTDRLPLAAALNLKKLLPDCEISVGMFEIHLDGTATGPQTPKWPFPVLPEEDDPGEDR